MDFNLALLVLASAATVIVADTANDNEKTVDRWQAAIQAERMLDAAKTRMESLSQISGRELLNSVLDTVQKHTKKVADHASTGIQQILKSRGFDINDNVAERDFSGDYSGFDINDNVAERDF